MKESDVEKGNEDHPTKECCCFSHDYYSITVLCSSYVPTKIPDPSKNVLIWKYTHTVICCFSYEMYSRVLEISYRYRFFDLPYHKSIQYVRGK